MAKAAGKGKAPVRPARAGETVHLPVRQQRAGQRSRKERPEGSFGPDGIGKPVSQPGRAGTGWRRCRLELPVCRLLLEAARPKLKPGLRTLGLINAPSTVHSSTIRGLPGTQQRGGLTGMVSYSCESLHGCHAHPDIYHLLRSGPGGCVAGQGAARPFIPWCHLVGMGFGRRCQMGCPLAVLVAPEGEATCSESPPTGG